MPLARELTFYPIPIAQDDSVERRPSTECLVAVTREKKTAEGSYSLPSVINKDRRSNGPESPRSGRPFFIQSAIIVENTNTGEIYLPISEFDSIEIFKRDTEILPSWIPVVPFSI